MGVEIASEVKIATLRVRFKAKFIDSTFKKEVLLRLENAK